MSNNQWPGAGQPNGPVGQPGWSQPQQNPGGYPQPPHPHGGQPYPQGGQPYPHGGQPLPQPTQPYGQQPYGAYPGHAQPGPAHPYGPGNHGPGGQGYSQGAPTPPGRRVSPLLIAVIVVLVLLLGAGGVYLATTGKKKDEPVAQPTQSTPEPTTTATRTSSAPSPTPTPSKSPSTKTPTPTPSPTPTHDNFKRPEFPDSFGNFTTISDFEKDPESIWDTQVYESSRDRFVAGYVPGEFLFEIATEGLESSETFGDSVCGKQTEDELTYYACYTKTHRGVLQTALATATTPSDVNAVTQEFIAAWQ